MLKTGRSESQFKQLSRKGFNIWSDDNRALYNQDVSEIGAFYSEMWKAWCTTHSFDELLDEPITDQMYLVQVMTYDEFVESFNLCLEKAFMRYATRAPRISFVETDGLKLLGVARRQPGISGAERTRLSKQIFKVRRRERVLWRSWLVSQAAQGSWRHKRVLSRLDDVGRQQRVFIPIQLTDIEGQYVQYARFAEAALAAVKSVSSSHDLFHDSPALVNTALTDLCGTCRHDEPFTNVEFGQALLGLSCGKAMGSDNLISEMYKLLGYDNWCTFLDWCNRFLGHFALARGVEQGSDSLCSKMQTS